VTKRGAPSLEVLDLRVTFAVTSTDPPVDKSRVQLLLDMMKVNTSIHTIHLFSRYRRHAVFRESVIPLLETNRFRPRLLAIQKIRPIPYRAKVLGRALVSARTNSNRFWMLFSENPEVALFPSTTATTTPATNLPTPAPAAPSTATVAAVATTSPTIIGAASTISVSAVDSDATPMSD
jgi:hypothetical protein